MRRRTIKALEDPHLTKALESFAAGYRDARANALESKDFETLRETLRKLKLNAIENCDTLWSEFAENVEKTGAKVHFVDDACDAIEVVKQILNDSSAHKIVKSKSMLCEEIHLNDALADAGFEVIETDLGEWIVQLDKDRPSHMVMPAIHKTAEAARETLEREAGHELGDDIEAMVEYARERIRREFYAADAGITGANAAIASTGALMIVTNEGNARMATTEPGLHIAIVGREKIVPSTADALSILELLAPSATGQKISSYVSLITGGMDREMHIVVVDNGRSRMATDPVIRDVLGCIRCGACLNNCPSYLGVGGHVFGDVYMGGMGSAVAAFHAGIDAAKGPVSLCSGCGACVETCPVGIDIPGIVENVRRRIVAERGLPPVKGYVLRTILRDRKKFHILLKAAKVVQGPFTKGGYVRHMPLYLAGYSSLGNLPGLAAKPLRELVGGMVEAKGEKKMRVGLFSGCLIDFVYPEIGEKMIDLLTHFGCEVVIPERQSCCGIPASHVGEYDVAVEIARANIDAFDYADVNAIVTGCATCASALKGYPKLFASDDEEDVLGFAGKVHGICDFLVDVLRVDLAERLMSIKRGVVTYHDSCHLKRHLVAHTQPRRLLGSCGYALREMEQSDRCCGFAGTFALDYPELASHIRKGKVEAIDATGAGAVAMDCPGCLMHLRGEGVAADVLHTVELLWEAIMKR